MPSARSYSLADLVESTGFDRRTIVYYIQSGLLPKVGRRGPHTRYPEECLTRLLFIKGVKALQQADHVRTRKARVDEHRTEDREVLRPVGVSC